MLTYPDKFTADGRGGYLVQFPVVPKALTQGGTREGALRMAADALRAATDFYLEDARLCRCSVVQFLHYNGAVLIPKWR